MKRAILKSILYAVILLLSLELLVRVFHLHNDRPQRYLDEYGVEKWVPNQKGYSVTGNRRQNVGEYRINNFGFNSVYDNYTVSKDSIEVAIIGDSFIEGFHQDYTKSISRKVEKKLPNIKVLEFGYSGYHLAEEFNLIASYKHLFKDIDRVVIYMRFTDDLITGEYAVSSRLSLDTPMNRLLKKSKLIVYAKDIGAFDPVKNAVESTVNFIKKVKPNDNIEVHKDSIYLANFKKLVKTYNYDKEKNVLLLDYSLCSSEFLSYLKQNNFKTINFNEAFKKSSSPKTLIYDQHWNNLGREIIADEIVDYIKNEKLK
ncbi:hypothetical protein AX016_2887 [Cellulophaga sp. RHA19]|uniref:hypothetical protein n=1 Tax=Cellulophaga sp. RHA19 TaxID=1798237 RepID=UPI000C2CC51F|nr:hypothetical protein [Cellulophaga sp. RHA19]PKB44666.1 hypothetical protein AX016_2887 [Cellulophaga sp. RHA19]